MLEQNRTHGRMGAPHWLMQLLQRLSGDRKDDDHRRHPAETFINERPANGQFCTHGRLARLVARWRSRVGRTPFLSRDINGDRICPLCGRLPADRARTVYILTVRFHDGEVSEYTFESPCKHDCYRLSDDTLHIYFSDTSVSYAMGLIVSINFGARVVLPVPPEVLEAERILAKRSSFGH